MTIDSHSPFTRAGSGSRPGRKVVDFGLAPQLTSERTVGSLGDRAMLRVDTDWYGNNRERWQQHIGSNFVDAPDILAFTFIDLENGFSDGITPNYSDTPVIGRAEAYKVFTSSSNREVSFTVQFQAQGLANVDEELSSATDREVMKPVRWLSALRQPIIDRSSGLSYAPPPVFLKIGNLYAMRAVVQNLDIQWNGPFDPETMQPMHADVTITLAAVSAGKNYENLYAGIYGTTPGNVDSASFAQAFA